MSTPLINTGSKPSNTGVRAYAVIERLYVVKHSYLSGVTCSKVTQVYTLTFKAGEEVLRYGIVPESSSGQAPGSAFVLMLWLKP